MKILPSAPTRDLTFTERKVFELLRTVEWGAGSIALSSVNLSDHEYKRWGELDFVVVSPQGLFAFEVKGGDVSCKDGVWTYRTSKGALSRSESAYAQVKGSFFSLEKQLVKETGLQLAPPISGGFGVIFAGMRARDLASIVGGPEMPLTITATSEDLENAERFRRYLERVSRHWREHSSKTRAAWDAAQIKRITHFLRPDFDRAVPLSLRAKAIREERVRFTEEQYELLDFLDSEPRLFVTSGAGCGKTFIAIEVARREHARGRSVLLIAGTESLARYIQTDGYLPRGIAVCSAGGLKAKIASWQANFDIVIVDEGQQVTTRAMWDSLDSVLKGGMEQGRWWWFGDYSRQIAADSIVESGTLELLKWASTHQHLLQNCRNTPQLIKAAEVVSGARIGRPLVRGAGPDLSWCAPQNREEAARQAGAKLRAWLQEDVGTDSITLLHASTAGHAEAVAAAEHAQAMTGEWESIHHARVRKPILPIAAVREFRGLESEYVMIFGLDDVTDDSELRALAYIAVTRANFAAVIACSASLQERLLMLALADAKGVVGAGSN